MGFGFFKGTKAKLLPSTGIEFSDGRFYTYGSGSPEGVVTATVGSFYSDTTNGIIYTKNSGAGNTGWDTVTSSATNYLLVTDTKSSGTDGGTFTNGAWRTRDLNTIDINRIAGVTLVSNQIVDLPAGKYKVKTIAPAYTVDGHKSRLRNITAGTTLKVGTTARASYADAYITNSFITGEFDLASTSTIELQHQAQSTGTTDGFGRASGFSEVEIYSIVELWRIA